MKYPYGVLPLLLLSPFNSHTILCKFYDHVLSSAHSMVQRAPWWQSQSTWALGFHGSPLERAAMQKNHIVWVVPSLVILKQSLSRHWCNVMFVNPSVFASPNLVTIFSSNQTAYFLVPFWPQWVFLLSGLYRESESHWKALSSGYFYDFPPLSS